jgi:hypothetical protein
VASRGQFSLDTGAESTTLGPHDSHVPGIPKAVPTRDSASVTAWYYSRSNLMESDGYAAPE